MPGVQRTHGWNQRDRLPARLPIGDDAPQHLQTGYDARMTFRSCDVCDAPGCSDPLVPLVPFDHSVAAPAHWIISGRAAWLMINLSDAMLYLDLARCKLERQAGGRVGLAG